MTADSNINIVTYFYRSTVASSRHRNLVSAYLVERHRHSNVVARIQPLGLLRTKVIDREIAQHGVRLHLVPSGRWHATTSNHHARVRVQPDVEVTSGVTVPG